MARILVTTDDSPLGRVVLTRAQALAGTLHADLTVQTVLIEPPTVGDFVPVSVVDPVQIEAQRTELREWLSRAVPGALIRVPDVGRRSVSQVIVNAAREEQAALIVISTHGRSGLSRLMLGPWVEAVLHTSVSGIDCDRVTRDQEDFTRQVLDQAKVQVHAANVPLSAADVLRPEGGTQRTSDVIVQAASLRHADVIVRQTRTRPRPQWPRSLRSGRSARRPPRQASC